MEGYLDSRFNHVGDAFMEGFEAGRDVGASLAVSVDGELVVDVWHGHTDRKRQHPWQRDTLVCMFSVTKLMTSLCLLQAVDRGLLELDAPVADVWPDFAGQGKEAITLRHLMSHQAGLVGFHERVDRDMLYDWHRFTAQLAAETPWWTPGEKHGYHAQTFGHLLGEVLRRRTGKTVGQWFRDEIAAPLELDFAIGLTEADLDRCAEMLPARMRPGELDQLPASAKAMMRDFNDASTPTGAAFQSPPMGPGYRNSREFRMAEIPASNGHGTARSVVKMLDSLADLASAETLQQATTTQSLGPDQVLKAVTHFGLGLMLHCDETPIGVRPGSFGHAGAGGAVAFRDPEAGVSFCFAMNQMEAGVISGGASAAVTAAAALN